ncbi:hypothetical protein GCM10010472_12990 [Pseudonocardia halophobica]|uniref:Uncharacterized protein n=1 Tax=Pseudonocardia halophobica TaxID=29401 RepID=A0A9W6NWJ7_9PSEU|nr:hypothetical protein GCM10017577_31100 [Pseudonocardia halophobica]
MGVRPGPTEEHRMTQPHEPASAPDEVPTSAERPATTGPYDDETLARLLHDLDVANDWHP